MIPIRDERMRDVLFETARFPTATLGAKIDLPNLTALAAGESRNLDIDGVLALKEAKLPLRLEVTAARLSDNAMLVASRKPTVVYAGSVGLAAAVEQLREVAALPSISKAVPVNFVLIFERGAGNLNSQRGWRGDQDHASRRRPEVRSQQIALT